MTFAHAFNFKFILPPDNGGACIFEVRIRAILLYSIKDYNAYIIYSYSDVVWFIKIPQT